MHNEMNTVNTMNSASSISDTSSGYGKLLFGVFAGRLPELPPFS